jgi:hypothetical protein
MKKNLLFLLIIVAFTCSCSTKTFIPAPAKPLPPVNVTCNHYEYGIENVDKAAKCDRTTLTAFYESFNIKYYLVFAEQYLTCLLLMIYNTFSSFV